MEYFGGEALEEIAFRWIVSVRGFKTALSHYHIVSGNAALEKAVATVIHSPAVVARSRISRAAALARLEDAVGCVV